MQSRFLTNYTDTTFLATIQANLRMCTEFYFSVSFIKKAGLLLLLNDIKAAIERGAKGKIITSTYQNFTDIESLKSFMNLSISFDNFECHLDDECFYNETNYSTNGFHTKGYLFVFSDRCEIIIGSSNITRYALRKNIEWDLVVDCHRTDTAYTSVFDEFCQLWEHTYPLSYDHINNYAQKINFAIERWDMDYDLAQSSIKPNYMQQKALKELNRYRAIGENKALIISATGSGKTFLAAFDALNFAPNKLLYVVHEGSILQKSLETFQQVFGSQKTCGMYTGESKELEADFLFTTNVSMCRSLELFDKKEFDYIIIDECHHAVAETYRKITNYFEPEFLLGLTATEQRMDNQDVAELFGNNIPYELRLRDAIINDLIVPFHYYGIRDQLVDYGLNDSNSTYRRRLIAQISTVENCEFIHQQIEKYRPNEQKLKALAFCRNIQHARVMSEGLGEFYTTAYLSGQNKTGERIRAYNELQKENSKLEILFAVDILNEGVDIPGVNMVLFLRPTESSTIFIQQLGRGLRKFANKSYVTILDFIGNNYKRSVQIAVALGSLSKGYILEKKLLKSMVKEDFTALGLNDYGVKIELDDLAKEELINNIDAENFNSLNYLKKDYYNFKKFLKTPTYPKHTDYVNNDYAPNLLKFMKIKINGKKTNSYYNFLKGIQEESLPCFSEKQIVVINYLSNLLPLVRRHEYLIIKSLINGVSDLNIIRKDINSKIAGFCNEQLDHALLFMTNGGVITRADNCISFACEIEPEFIDYILDLLDYGLSQYNARYSDEDDFLLYQDYRQDQVLLKILENPQHNQLGTYYKDGNMYVFAGLKKDATISEHLNYKDKFLDNQTFQWESIANISNVDEQKQKNSSNVYIFVRKVKSENGITLPYTYVGIGHLQNPRKNKTSNGSILYDIHMDTPLPDELMTDFKWVE